MSFKMSGLQATRNEFRLKTRFSFGESCLAKQGNDEPLKRAVQMLVENRQEKSR